MDECPWIHETRPSKCPDCGMVTDAASNADKGETAQPRPGDYSICFDCTALLVFDANLRLRFPTPTERAAAPPETVSAIAKLALFNASGVRGRADG